MAQGLGKSNRIMRDGQPSTITVDSGVVDAVGPKGIARGFPLIPTNASKKGMCYRAANDTKIAIHGKKELYGYTPEGSRIGLDVQIADVKKALGSVRRMCEAGNRVVLDEEESYVEHKHTGERTVLTKEKRGAYVLTVWVPRKGSAGHRSPPFPRQGMRVQMKLNP